MRNSTAVELTKLFAGATAVSVAFFLYGAWQNHSWIHANLLWNLTLAWIPYVLSLVLIWLLKHRVWSSWPVLIVTALWLGFLPNAFYLITDFIHLFDVHRDDVVYDILMMGSFVTVGVLLGYASVGMIHEQLRRRMTDTTVWGVIAAIFLASSFAIYVGRELRWNTWDIITNPTGILFDISERIINPGAHPQTFIITLSCFAFFGTGYAVAWRAMHILQKSRINS
jgi:uncharacterized membrane protein